MFVVLLISSFGKNVYSQTVLCGHDNATNLSLLQQISSDENTMQEDMESNPQGIMNNVTYTLPVVFHILHLGEAEGSGSNISRDQVLLALSDLNSHFANSSGTGYDVGIQFCLAQQDPEGNSQYDAMGNNITGIRRVNASSVPYFDAFGIWSGVNEVQAKALSNWPEADYVEIWVAHRLYTGSGDAAGFAYFPAAGDDIDGIALRADATGIGANSKVITHEGGHFFGLYHTFHQGSITQCPPNSNCQQDGDMNCDTRPHKQFGFFPFPCDESLYTSCDPSFSLPYQVTRNHMNYTDNDCRDEFTPQQAMRMRCALLSLRGSLTNSIGCSQGCPTVFADFTLYNPTVGIGTNVNFLNLSTGASSFVWNLNGEYQSSSLNWSYQFQMGGTYEICLDAYGDNGCIRRICKKIDVIPSCIPVSDPCERVQNGNFEQIAPSLDVHNFKNVCGWENIQSSPFFCDAGNNAIGMWFSSNDNERVTSSHPLNLTVGTRYNISFDYLVTNASPSKIILAMAESNTPTGSPGAQLESTAAIIAEISNPGIVYIGQFNNKCYMPNHEFMSYSGTFSITDPIDQYLTITGMGTGLGSIVFIDNVSIDFCNVGPCYTNPDFTFDIECPKNFMGTNINGDQGEYTWNFLCNGISLTGPSVTIDLPPGQCEVCLTINCDQETSNTICKKVTIPEISNNCTPSCTPLSISLSTCEQDAGKKNTFLANITLSVPDGTGPCPGSGVVSGSQSMDIDVSSYTSADDPNDPSKDIISIGLNVTTPQGFDLLNNDIAGSINLCDPQGNIICYTLSFTGQQCDACGGEINAIATCNDANPVDNSFTYSGNVTIDLPFDYRGHCGSISDQAGYNQTISGSGNTVNVNFSITTGDSELLNATSLLCFTMPDGGKMCYTLKIAIQPCIIDFECGDKWASKPVFCTKSKDGTLTYNFSMGQGMIGSGPYVLCSDGLQGLLTDEDGNSIPGGFITINSFSQNAGSFLFDIDINVPCSFEGQTIILKLIFCTNDGNEVCFEFPLILTPCHFNCDDGDGVKGRSKKQDENHGVLIHPNPANDKIMIKILSKHNNMNIMILDIIGESKIQKSFYKETEIDTEHLTNGLYLVLIYDDTGNLYESSKIIIHH